MIQPQPFKFVCPKCGYSIVIKPKSDQVHPYEMMNNCHKCKSKMERKSLNVFDSITSIFK
jgi:DNA-directed RNA polymerase subunit RPC12/RpoP